MAKEPKPKPADVDWEAFDGYDPKPGRSGPPSQEAVERRERMFGDMTPKTDD